MEDAAPNPAVLFVDLTDSTRLYEQLGDTRAREASSIALQRWETIVLAAEGRVVKRIGDELMCVFPGVEAAAKAAMEIQVDLDRGLPELDFEFHAKIGFHAGPLLEEDGDVFGDTVNMAARMVSLAKPGEILTNAATVTGLPPFYAACARPRGETAVKGKTGAFGVVELVWKAEEQTRMAESRAGTDIPRLRLEVRIGEDRHEVQADQPVLRVGRHPHNEIVVEGELISRSHARIEYRKSRFVLVDESTNGTWIHTAEGTRRLIRGDESVLPAAGHLGLGESVEPEDMHAIRFVMLEPEAEDS